MSTLVIDASVAAKWFLPPASEPLRDEALDLLRGYAAGQLHFAVPDLFWAECGNIFWKAVRQRRWTHTAAEQAMHSLTVRGFATTTSLDLAEDALSIALTFERTVYDAIYVALALRLNVDLVTADKPLAAALAAHLPVKWLGSVR